MAFRGAIAISKGIKVHKIQEEKKKARIQKWQINFKSQKSMFPELGHENGIEKSGALHTDQDQVHKVRKIRRSGTININSAFASSGGVQIPNSITKFNSTMTWNNALYENENDSSLTSSELSSVD